MDNFINKLQYLIDEINNNIQAIKEITSKNYELAEIIFNTNNDIRKILEKNNESNFGKSNVGFEQWKLYQHRSVVTQLYAIYEDFVEKLIEIWIDNLPKIFDKYLDLGIDFQKQYILGIAKLIERLNRKKYQQLTLEELIKIPENTNINYKLVKEVFTHHDNNLRMSELNILFLNSGVKGLSEWIAKSEEIKNSEYIINNNENKIEKGLDNFIDYRNDACHNIIQISVLKYKQLIDLCDFIQLFCLSLHDLILYHIIDRMIILNKLRNLGKIRQYRDKLKSARLKVNNMILSLGVKTFLVNKETSICKFAIIEKMSIEVNDQFIDKDSIEISEEQDIWVQFNIEVKKNWEVYLAIGF